VTICCESFEATAMNVTKLNSFAGVFLHNLENMMKQNLGARALCEVVNAHAMTIAS